MGDRDERIRDEAYRLWVEAGRTHGDEQRHWYEAEKRIAESEKADEAAKHTSAKPSAERRAPKPREATGGAAAGAGSAAAKGPMGREAEAFAKSRPSRKKSDDAGAIAPGGDGAKPKAGKAAQQADAKVPGKGAAVEVAPARRAGGPKSAR